MRPAAVLVLAALVAARNAGATHTIRQVASDGTITRIAGTGVAGYSGDGGDPLSAQLNSPYALERNCCDASGNSFLYIADAGNHAIRKIVYLSGGGAVISTLAGNGTPGLSGDGGPATAAQLNAPRGLISFYEGDVYIADTGNHVIRRVSSYGTITRLAGTGVAGYSGDGGSALAAQLNSPYALSAECCDGSGYPILYVADSGNHVIRKLTNLLSGAVITTVAGNGMAGSGGDGGLATAAQLNSPRGIKSFGEGYLYIADTGNHEIRSVVSGGVITRVAGTGVAGYSGDGGSALAAQLNSPYALSIACCDGTGHLFVSIADAGNNAIRRMTLLSSGPMMTTVAGTGVAGTGGDGGPATSAQLNAPRGVVYESEGMIDLADTGTNLDSAAPSSAAAGDKANSVVVAPTVLDRSVGGSVQIVVRGAAGQAVELQVYDAAGDYLGSWHLTLDAQGRSVSVYRGEPVGGRALGSGVYRIVPKGAHVTGTCAFVVRGKR